MENNEAIHIKISSKFRTLHILPIAIAGRDSRCILEIENTGETKLPKMDFRWKIESGTIDIGKDKKSTAPGFYYNIYAIELEPGGKKEESFFIRPFIPGHHKLTVGVPDSVKGGDAIVGETTEQEVAGKAEQRGIRFHADPEMHFGGPWYTYFEVYTWYFLLGILSASVLIISGVWKLIGEILKAIFWIAIEILKGTLSAFVSVTIDVLKAIF